MKENGISIKSIHECREKYQKDIDEINSIFDSDEPSCVKKRLVLLKLISRDRADENLKYYIEAKNINADSITTDMEAYKAPIVRALRSNTDFYVKACNWYGFIQWEVNLINEKKISSIKPWKLTTLIEIPLHKLVADTNATVFLPFSIQAVETPPEIQPPGSLTVEYKKLDDGLFNLRFIFSFKEPCEKPPYLPLVEYLPSEKSEKLRFRFKPDNFHKNISSLVYHLFNVEISKESKVILPPEE
jgi:hypothetical protein